MEKELIDLCKELIQDLYEHDTDSAENYEIILSMIKAKYN